MWKPICMETETDREKAKKFTVVMEMEKKMAKNILKN